MDNDKILYFDENLISDFAGSKFDLSNVLSRFMIVVDEVVKSLKDDGTVVTVLNGYNATIDNTAKERNFVGYIDDNTIIEDNCLVGKLENMTVSDLKKGDVLPLKKTISIEEWDKPIKWSAKRFSHSQDMMSKTIRVIKGLQYDAFTESSQRSFEEKEYTVMPESDRMGYRLDGAKLSLKDQKEFLKRFLQIK